MKLKSRFLNFLLALSGLVALMFVIEFIAVRIDRFLYPWGYLDSGKPPLVGTWTGRVTTGSGKHLGMMLSIQLAPLDRGREKRGVPIIRTQKSHWLEAQIAVCDGPNVVRHLTGDGTPADNAASRFHLGFSSEEIAPDGLCPSHIYGQWTGGDTLDLQASLYQRKGRSSVTNSADPDTGQQTAVQLNRGSEPAFVQLCRSL